MLNRLKHLFGDKKNKEFGINNITPIEKIAPKEQIDLIRFFKNELPDSKGRYHKDILQFNHEQIEYNHDFIQWILPTIDKSQFHPEAPTIDGHFKEQLQHDDLAKSNYCKTCQLYLNYIGFHCNKRRIQCQITGRLYELPFHNQLRITRMLNSLNQVGNNQCSTNLYHAIISEIKPDSDKINNSTLEFLNCTIINNDTTEDTISMNFSGCVFRNCHLDSGYRISGGDFNSCSLLIDGNINNASINDCSLHGGGTSYSCNIRKSDVRVITLEAGNIEYSDIAHCILNDSVSVKGCKLHSCTIYGAKFSSEFTEIIGCSSAFKTAFNGSANEIKGFIFGCDFSGLEGIPGVMKGVQCCKFKSALLSQGIILADIFGHKNAASNGMNTGV